MSPLGGTWTVSAIIWGVFVILFVAYNRKSIKGFILRKPRSTKVKPPLRVTITKVDFGHRLFDNGEGIIQFLINLTLKASPEIQLGKLDLVYDGKPYPPVGGLPTSSVKGIQSYEVEYRVYGDSGYFHVLRGLIEENSGSESQLPDVQLRIMAGGFDFTEPVPLVSRKIGSRT